MTDQHSELLAACSVLGGYAQDDLIWGHASVRDSEGRGAWMKSSRLGFEEMTADLLVLVDDSGTTLAGGGTRHIESPIHTEIMRSRPDVGAVVHTHWPHVVAFGATGMPMRPISHDATLFVPDRLARYGSGELITTPEQGRAVAEALEDRPAILLAHHGMVTVGADVAEAVVTAVMLERAARLQLLTAAATPDFSYSSDDEAIRKRDQHFTRSNIEAAWAYLLRRVQGSSSAT
ncbi:class II aldolase/adducin family protein [Nocardioides sp. LHG3406-4]|uniref:class II aldolase/adducin family protein n=1 Tax=Nocardioides sp. LHG3406-4 TaxID=2804575 RepID=UPI003CE69CBC